MIDIHAHYLPHLDDGAASFEEALAMVEMAIQDGITHVVLTPHVAEGEWDNTPAGIAAQAQQLREQCAARNLDLEFSLGGEVRLRDDLPERLRQGQIPTINDQGKYLLLEFPLGGFPMCTDEVLFQLQMQGLKPIIAHPERHLEFQEDPKRLYKMSLSGILGQVTAHSLLGGYGPEVQKLARFMVKHRLVQCLASDSHSPSTRPPMLSAGVAAAAKIIGPEEAQRLVTEYPQRIIEGQPVTTQPLEPKPKRSFFAFLKRKRKPPFENLDPDPPESP